MDTDNEFRLALNKHHAESVRLDPSGLPEQHVTTTFSWKGYLTKQSHSMASALVIIQWFIFPAQDDQYVKKKKSSYSIVF